MERFHAYVTALPQTGKLITVGPKMEALPVRQLDVNAGENRGVRLTHDHVVRALMGPYTFDAEGEAAATATFARPAERGRDAALVAVVQDAKSGEILQTLTLPCGG